VLEGNGWFNGLPVKSGQGFLMWQNRVNSMSADMRHPWKFIYISFSGSLAEQIIMRAGFTPEDTIFEVREIEHIKRVCEEMVYEYHPECIADMKNDFIETAHKSQVISKKEARLNMFESAFAEVMKVFSPLL
jgi:hypothetical protein